MYAHTHTQEFSHEFPFPAYISRARDAKTSRRGERGEEVTSELPVICLNAFAFREVKVAKRSGSYVFHGLPFLFFLYTSDRRCDGYCIRLDIILAARYKPRSSTLRVLLTRRIRNESPNVRRKSARYITDIWKPR